MKDHKICKLCNKDLPIINFWKHPNNKDGYFGKCKPCALTLVSNTQTNKQKLLKDNIWTCPCCGLNLNLDTINFHKDKSTSTKFKYKCKICTNKHRRNFTRMSNKDDLNYFLKEVLSAAKSRAIKKSLEYDMSMEFLEELWNNQKGKCAITHIDMTHTILQGRIPTNLSIDRIDSNRGYTRTNVQFVCVAINIMKSNLSMSELKYFCKLIIQNNE
jgi:hypothetical protein